jgi:cobalt/nickel transport system permease protein
MLDHFANRSTSAHRLDPAAKTLALLAVILAVVLVTPDRFLPLVPVAVALAIYHGVSRTPLRFTLRRLAVVSPFAVVLVVLFPFLEPGEVLGRWPVGGGEVTVTREGLVRAGHLLSKFVLCSWAALLLLATTRFQDLLQGLARLRVPRVFVTQLAVLYRYLWVLMDEGMHMRMARAARDGGLGPWRLRWRSRAGVVGVLFLRSWDRAERIYRAMAARGFDGTLHAPRQGRMRVVDWVFAAAVLAGGVALVLGDRVLNG